MIKQILLMLLKDYGVKAIVFVIALYTLNWLRCYNERHQEAHSKSINVLGKLGSKGVNLTEYEEIIATEIIHADKIQVNFSQIGGLDDMIQDLRECVVYPLSCPELCTTPAAILGAPPGVLLYGPPGCGKTTVVKALAKESNVTFINLHISTLTNKSNVEPSKLVSAVFSLARKLQPTIIFIDELDSFLRARRGKNPESTCMIRAEFMNFLDEMTAGETDRRIMVLGATNQPNAIDAAFLRRMPKRFAVGLPTDTQRKSILKLLLKDIKLADDFDMDLLVQHTLGCSGSNLKEMCHNAAMIPIHEIVVEENQNESKDDTAQRLANLDIKNADRNLRPLTLMDFLKSKGTTHHL